MEAFLDYSTSAMADRFEPAVGGWFTRPIAAAG
jgi:hypothetical protein